MKEPYIVYYHIGAKLAHTVVKGISPAEVTDIVKERFKKKNCGIDSVIPVAKESEMNETRFYAL